jgi:hypothetical protein
MRHDVMRYLKLILICVPFGYVCTHADDLYLKNGVLFRNVIIIDTTGAVLHIIRDSVRTGIPLELVERIDRREFIPGLKSAREIYSLSVAGKFLKNVNPKEDDAGRKIIWKQFDGPTVGIQMLLASGLSIGWISIAYPKDFTGSDNTGMQGGIVNSAQIAVAIIGVIFVPTGIAVGGEIVGGSGNTWGMIGGSILGGGIGFIAAENGSVIKASKLIYLCESVGGILGYHLTASPVYGTLNTSSTFLHPVPEYQMTLCSIQF